MNFSSLIAAGLLSLATVATGALATASTPYECATESTAANRIDDLVLARLKKLHLEPARPCSDAVFVRRAFIDLIGTIPTAHETEEFLLSGDRKKRANLVDRLLGRDEFVNYWALKWSDLLRVKSEFPINLWPNAAQAYYHWIHASLAENKPYDQFARELLLGGGSNFRDPPGNFYRAMQNREPAGIAQTVAVTFMGARADKWPTNELANLAVFFSRVAYKSTAEWKEEIVFFDPDKTNARPAGAVFMAVLPDGKSIALLADRDPRVAFADWLITPKNPWFTRNIVNRVWAWLLGRGIIHEPDDIRADNRPSNPELLAYLERELVSSHYDLKHLYRLIANSQTYQRACIPDLESAQADANFARYPLRRLEAEVLIDALDQITTSTEKYSSPIPEPFTFIPEDHRSIELPDGSITSAFLEMFGRPPRDTGLESERNNRPSAAQELHLLNSSHVLRKIEQSRMIEYQLSSKKAPNEIAAAMYLGILSRFPTPEEQKIVEAHFQSTGRREAAIDLAWALVNSPEFLYRH